MNDSTDAIRIEGSRQARPDDRDAILATANRVMRTEANKPPTIASEVFPLPFWQWISEHV